VQPEVCESCNRRWCGIARWGHCSFRAICDGLVLHKWLYLLSEALGCQYWASICVLSEVKPGFYF